MKFTSNKIKYETISDTEVRVLGCSSDDITELEIPAEVTSKGVTYKVTKIGKYAFGCKDLTSVTIPDSVTVIGEHAFNDCTGLTSVTIPDSVTKIEKNAFDGCRGLTSVTIPDSVTEIGYFAFQYCWGLTSVTIPDSVKICSYAFEDCIGLTSVTIPHSVTYLGGFEGCTGLTSVTIPDSVTEIGQHTFKGCTGLTSVTIPDSVTKIGQHAFEGCTGLTSVTIPDSVTKIDFDVFDGCTGLTSVTIPDSVTTIGNFAFQGCSGLTSVTIPDSVTEIGEHAFEGCTGLTSVTIPDSVTHLGGFGGCPLTSVTIPDSVTYLGGFDGCTGLTSVTIPDSVTKIGCSAFKGCSGLTSVTIPDSVTKIYSGAFSGCTGLTSVTIPDSVDVDPSAFKGCTNLKREKRDLNTFSSFIVNYSNGNSFLFTITSDTTVSIDGAWDRDYYEGANEIDCDNSDEVESIMPVVKRDPNISVVHCRGNVKIPSSVSFNGHTYTVNDMDWFYSDDEEDNELTGLIVPDTVTNINECGCNFNLGYINIPASVKVISESAFYNCGLGNIDLDPENKYFALENDMLICKEDNTVIWGCSTDKLVIPDSVKRVGFQAFYPDSPSEVVLPASIESLGEYCFGNDSVKKVTCLAKNPPKLEENAFVDNIKKLYVPEEYLSVYKDEWGDFVDNILPVKEKSRKKPNNK